MKSAQGSRPLQVQEEVAAAAAEEEEERKENSENEEAAGRPFRGSFSRALAGTTQGCPAASSFSRAPTSWHNTPDRSFDRLMT